MFQNSFLLQVTQVGSSASSVSVESIPQTQETLPIFSLLLDSWTIMLPLLILSIIAVYIWVERYTYIRKATKVDPTFMANIKNFVSQGKVEEAKALCKANNTTVSRMLDKGLSRLGRPLEDISASVENVARLEVSNMEKNLSILATISGASPMLGFLGTVIGMMDTFHKMAAGSAEGGIQIGDLSQGIMYAMTTTVGGLIVGILAYLGYNLMVAKVDKVVNDMEDKSMEFMDLLHSPSN